MFVDDLFNKKTLTENNGGGSPWHSEPEQQQMDANRRGGLERERNAGLDEPDDAASGSAPVQTRNGVYEYTVPAGQESIAQELGLQQHRGHWVSRVPIQRANFQFGRPQFHEIPSQGVAEGKEQQWTVTVGTKTGGTSHTMTFAGTKEQAIKKAVARFGTSKNPVVKAVPAKQSTNEGMLDNPGEQDSPVAQAIIRRILLQRTDLLSKYGPEKVGAAVDEVADFVGDVEEIGSSDVSGWIRHVEQMLGNMGEGVAEGWQEEADEIGKWAEYVRTKLLQTPKQQRWPMAGQLSQIEVKNFGSKLIPHKNYDNKTGKPVASQSYFTEIVQRTLRALAKPEGMSQAGYQSLTLTPQDIDKPDDRGGKDWVVDAPLGWLVVPNAGQAPGRVKRLLWKAYNAGPEIYPLALEVWEETGDFTEQDYKDIIIKAAELRDSGGLEGQAYQQYNQQQGIAEGADDELYGLRVGDTVKAVINGKRVQGDVVDIFPETQQVELLLRGANAGRTVTVDVQDTESMMENSVSNQSVKQVRPATPDELRTGYTASKSHAVGADGNVYYFMDPKLKQVGLLRNKQQGVAEGGNPVVKIKAPRAPSSPALAAPKAPAVAETIAQVERMLESVNSKKSAEMIKAYVDQKFTEMGLRNTTECRNLMTHVVQESAVRRRQYAKSLAK